MSFGQELTMGVYLKHGSCTVFIILFLMILKIACYEKTLRTIVRNQSRMVQKPFSENSATSKIMWKTGAMTRPMPYNQALDMGYGQTKTLYHNQQRPKISTILSSLETNRHKMLPNKKHNDTLFRNEPRSVRNTLPISASELKPKIENTLYFETSDNGSQPKKLPESVMPMVYTTPVVSRFFPPIQEPTLQNIEKLQDAKRTIEIPQQNDERDNSSVLVKSIYMADVTKGKDNEIQKSLPQSNIELDVENYKPDYVIEEMPVNSLSYYSYNLSSDAESCQLLPEMKANVDTQLQFFDFDIEPIWMTKTQYWNNIFDSRYEALMRNPKWPPLKVILIPRTHVDSIWKKTFDEYYYESVHKILSNMVKKLHFYKKFTFTWNEVSHLSHWWKLISAKRRMLFRRLLRNDQIEITTGGWVETDEATTNLFGLVHNLVEGHQWLYHYLNYSPRVAWATNTVSHSSTMPYLLTSAGMPYLVFTNVHFSWEQYLAEYQYSDFIWLQDWESNKFEHTKLNNDLNKMGTERYPNHAMLTHFLQFNSAGFRACGPNKALCLNDFNFAIPNKNVDINMYNIIEKAESLLEQYSKSGTLTHHNTIIAPLGGPYRYEVQAEFDFQYNNYQKLSEFINANQNIYKASIDFGTPINYFESITNKTFRIPTLKGDFMNFADLATGAPAYWTGFFTSRPLLKVILRRLQSTLRSTEMLVSFAISYNAFRDISTLELSQTMTKARENTARLLDRNVVSGTLTAKVVKYVYSLVLSTAKDLWRIQELSASMLSIKPDANITYLQKFIYKDGELSSMFKTVAPGDQVYIFNSLSHERIELVEVMTTNYNIRVVDHNGKDVSIQINPVWRYVLDTISISSRYFKVIFAVAVPPLSLQLFKIKETYSALQKLSTIYCSNCAFDQIVNEQYPVEILPIESGDIQLQSYKHRLIFDEASGFLKTVINKENNQENTVIIDYGAFRSSSANSGMFLFSTNVTRPLEDLLSKYRYNAKLKSLIIVSGSLSTEYTSIYGKLLQHTVQIFNMQDSPLSNAIYVESKVDYESSPKNRELELFLSIQTDIANGSPSTIFSDNNGFHYVPRFLNTSRRIESNMYPITSMAFIQDAKSRLSLLTEHAQAVTALQEGQLLVLLERRVLYSDGRGNSEGLADSDLTCHRHYILLETFENNPKKQFQPKAATVNLPSTSAVYLANSLDYGLDIFLIDKAHSQLCHYPFLPLIKSSFPCDVNVLNYRVIFYTAPGKYNIPNTALLILHRQSLSCQIDRRTDLHCSSDSNFSIDKIIRNFKTAYKTNLVGTDMGKAIRNFNLNNFPPKEVLTLRIQF